MRADHAGPTGEKRSETRRAAGRSKSEAETVRAWPTLQPLRLQRCACGGSCPSCLDAGLELSSPGDRLEQEAEQAAGAVARGNVVGSLLSASPATVQRRLACDTGSCTHTEDEENELLVQRATDPAGRSAPTGGAVREVLGAAGQPLDTTTRGFMESRFGQGFENVRVHTSARAAEAAHSVAAKAITVGSNVVFGSGQFAPSTNAGRELIAHELSHTIQQAGGRRMLQRTCDPGVLALRTEPIFFPRERTILEVFGGTRSLRRWTGRRTAVGLIQQALADLGYSLGPYGSRRDGVDRIFGPVTEQAVTDFQTDESVATPTPGVVDQATLRCLDEVRSKRVVPEHQRGTVTPDQYRIDEARTGGRDEDVFFDRGSSTTNAEGRAKIAQLASSFHCWPMTLEGFISEDELADQGPQLATDRIDDVDSLLLVHGHETGCSPTPPGIPRRQSSPRPNASSGVSDYRSRRKVEVVLANRTSTTVACPPDAPRHRPLNPVDEVPVLTAGVNRAVAWLDTAIPKLVPGNADGDAALTAYFGGTGRRSRVRNNLGIWRNHLNTVIRVNNRHGTQCLSVCEKAIAFNVGVGSEAQMTICPAFFGNMSFHPPLNQDEKKAFVLLHEAGHGSIDTADVAYGHRRLIEFLALYPDLAIENTDSYTLMVLCLNDFDEFCTPPEAPDASVNMSDPEFRDARRGLGWLESWLTWTSQDTSGAYSTLQDARIRGVSPVTANGYYGTFVYPVLVREFDIHRPTADAPPTLREQTTVAAILDRLRVMKKATRRDASDPFFIAKDDSAGATMSWASGGPLSGPGRALTLTPVYFALTTDRRRVETMLPLIIAASTSISSAMGLMYERYIIEDIRRSPTWKNQPR